MKRLLPIIAAAAIGLGVAATADAQVTLNPGGVYPTFPVTVYAAGQCTGQDESVIMPWANFGLTAGPTGAVSIASAGATFWFNGAATPYTTQYADIAVGNGSGPKDDHAILFIDPTTRHTDEDFTSGFFPEFEPDDHLAFHISCTQVPGGWQALVRLGFVDNADH